MAAHNTSSPPAKLFIEEKDEEALKCLATAAASKVKLEVERLQKNQFAYGHAPYLQTEGATLFSANAICRFLADNTPALDSSNLVVDRWIEWEETVLRPAFLAAKKSSDKTVMNAALIHLNEHLQTQFVTGSELTLADIILGATVSSALAIVKEEGVPIAAVKSFSKAIQSQSCVKAGKSALESSLSAKSNTTDSDVSVDPKSIVLPELIGTAVGDGTASDSVLEALVNLFTYAILKGVPQVVSKGFTKAVVRRSANPSFGEYQCNSAMQLLKMLKGVSGAPQNPAALGQAIIAAMPPTKLFKKLEVSGPGFINCHLSNEYASQRISTLLTQGVKPPPAKKLTVAVDFSSPNVAKEMHVGHLRSTIIGESICRLLEFCGHNVIRINHIGDWGTQFGMLIVHLMETYPDFKVNQPNISNLTAFYKAAKKRFDDDADFKKRAQLQVVKLQGGDKDSRELWEILCAISREAFDKVYNRLEVTLTECGESFYNPMIPGVIKELEQKGLVQVSNGAKVVFIPDRKVPLMVQKSDGGYGYDSTDIAAINYRFNSLKADWCIYITDAGQWDHFDLVFEAAKLAGIVQKGKHQVDHIGFGVVCGEDGKRFKTRSGDTVRLVDLLDEAKERMKKILLERIEAGQTSLKAEEADEAAEAIGYGAVKYFDLRQNPQSNYVFNYDRMLSTSGDTAVYLLFAHARLASIVRKSGLDVTKANGSIPIVLEHPAEWALAADLIAFQDTLNLMIRSLQPNVLCDYLYKISEKVSTFVTQCRVIGSEQQDSRVLLCEATAEVMRKCFTLLGIKYLMQI